MCIKLLTTSAEAERAAALTEENHSGLRKKNPFLPEKKAADFQPRIEWVMQEGQVFGFFENDVLNAFMGAFTIENFRNEGPASLTPDWCHYSEPSAQGRKNLIELYRVLLSEILGQSLRMHSICVYAHRDDTKEIFDLFGYGRIVMDAGASLDSLNEKTGAQFSASLSANIRKALQTDGQTLMELDSQLADHIRSIPVLMPGAHGSTRIEWENWLKETDAVAFLSEVCGKPVGFIKSQDPQFDVTFSVHDSGTLAINGLFVLPEARGGDVARQLLQEMVKEAKIRNKSIVSVDCETMNPEAYGFWTRYFSPLTWSLLRRY